MISSIKPAGILIDIVLNLYINLWGSIRSLKIQNKVCFSIYSGLLKFLSIGFCSSQCRNLAYFWSAICILGFPWWLSGKESACNAGDAGGMGLIPGSGRYPGGGNGNPLQYSCWKNSMDRGASCITVLGGHKESEKTEHSLTHPSTLTNGIV